MAIAGHLRTALGLRMRYAAPEASGIRSEVRADIGRTGTIQLVAGEALHDEEILASEWGQLAAALNRPRAQASAYPAKAGSRALPPDMAIARCGCCRPRLRSTQM
jgi:hypothetical protein